MKFLALAFLLAAGCQALLVQADAPSHYEQIRAVVVTYLTQTKESAQEFVANLDDDEFKDLKVFFNHSLVNIEAYIKSFNESLAIFHKYIGPRFVEIISDFFNTISHDLKEMHKELGPKRAMLYQVVKKHLEEYRTLIEPALKEYSEKTQQVVEEFKAKFEPVVKELQEKLKVNVEETKPKLIPIVEIIRNHLTKILEELKANYGPHIQDFIWEIEKIMTILRQKNQTGELQLKLINLVEKLRLKHFDIIETVFKDFEDIVRS